jgi:hypothetical protein
VALPAPATCVRSIACSTCTASVTASASPCTTLTCHRRNAGFGPGSAVTIEPGIYVRADVFEYLPDTPRNRAMIERLRPVQQRYVDIGIRIEDVYIFDERGVERVSRGVPREIDEIEALMREGASRTTDAARGDRGVVPRDSRQVGGRAGTKWGQAVRAAATA